MTRQAGTRVVAVRDADENVVHSFGAGVYVGDEVPPFEPFNKLEVKNPKIVLDSGDVVWGFQCWWGPEDGFDEKFTKGRPVEIVQVPS